jgi:type VI secretion system protein ImpE
MYQSGDLSGAIKALVEMVKKKPTDEASRALLAEFLLFDGAFDRADTQMTTISNLNPEKAVTIALWRQLVRGAVARDQLFAEGRVPEFLTPPPEHVQILLRGIVALREWSGAEAFDLFQQAEEARPIVSGRMGDTAFSGIRDLDDLFAPVMEVFTSTGKYFWVPFETIETVVFAPPQRPSDLVWRQAQMVVRDGTDGVVYVPAIYPPLQGADRSDALKLGRATEWVEGAEGIVRGEGQRCLLVGEEDIPIMSLETLEFFGPN